MRKENGAISARAKIFVVDFIYICVFCYKYSFLAYFRVYAY